MTLDPHGYDQLFASLIHMGEQLTASGKSKAAERINFATKFYGTGSPTEFLGESRLALEAILNEEVNLSGSIVTEIRETLEKINEGFRRADYK
jgi:hypothetical protein